MMAGAKIILLLTILSAPQAVPAYKLVIFQHIDQRHSDDYLPGEDRTHPHCTQVSQCLSKAYSYEQLNKHGKQVPSIFINQTHNCTFFKDPSEDWILALPPKTAKSQDQRLRRQSRTSG